MSENIFKEGDKLNGYTIQSFIGRGRDSEVYLAISEKWGKVALKCFINPELDYNAVLDEAFIMAVFGSENPHIVKVYDARFIGSYPVMACEYMEGGTLRDKLNKDKFIKLEEATKIIIQASFALRTLHQKGFVHRDVKPENIFFDINGNVKLGDFGYAVFCKTSKEHCIVGTFPYIAPELLNKPSSPLTDIYSLGIVLYEMLIGKPPFEMDELKYFNSTQKDFQVEFCESSLPQDIPQKMRIAILKATSFSPSERYQDLTDFLNDVSIYWTGYLRTEVSFTEEESGTVEGFPKIEFLVDPYEPIIDQSEKIRAERFKEQCKNFWEDSWGKFDEFMRNILLLSIRQAFLLKNFYIGIEHILLVLTTRVDGLFYKSLVRKGVSPSQLREYITNSVRGIKNTGNNLLTPRLNNIISRREKIGEREFILEVLKENAFINIILEKMGIEINSLIKELEDEI